MTSTPNDKDGKNKKPRRFIEHLWQQDRKAFAVLRRSLSQPPRQALAAIPYVERFAASEKYGDAELYYLVAGLFCLVERPLEPGQHPPTPRVVSFGESMGRLFVENEERKSTEQRFVRLLDADTEQLPARLRQCVTLLKSSETLIPIGWEKLLTDLRYWQSDNRQVQHDWARRFYLQTRAELPDPELQNSQDKLGENA